MSNKKSTSTKPIAIRFIWLPIISFLFICYGGRDGIMLGLLGFAIYAAIVFFSWLQAAKEEQQKQAEKEEQQIQAEKEEQLKQAAAEEKRKSVFVSKRILSFMRDTDALRYHYKFCIDSRLSINDIDEPRDEDLFINTENGEVLLRGKVIGTIPEERKSMCRMLSDYDRKGNAHVAFIHEISNGKIYIVIGYYDSKDKMKSKTFSLRGIRKKDFSGTPRKDNLALASEGDGVRVLFEDDHFIVESDVGEIGELPASANEMLDEDDQYYGEIEEITEEYDDDGRETIEASVNVYYF